MASYIEDNTSQSKDWIFDSGSTVYVYSQNELFGNSLVKKEKEVVIMVDDSIISTETVKVKEREGTVRSLETV